MYKHVQFLLCNGAVVLGGILEVESVKYDDPMHESFVVLV
jgi:hypothetical protein